MTPREKQRMADYLAEIRTLKGEVKVLNNNLALSNERAHRLVLKLINIGAAVRDAEEDLREEYYEF